MLDYSKNNRIFAAEFIPHLKEGNRRTLSQDALRPLLFIRL